MATERHQALARRGNHSNKMRLGAEAKIRKKLTRSIASDPSVKTSEKQETNRNITSELLTGWNSWLVLLDGRPVRSVARKTPA